MKINSNVKYKSKREGEAGRKHASSANGAGQLGFLGIVAGLVVLNSEAARHSLLTLTEHKYGLRGCRRVVPFPVGGGRGSRVVELGHR
jgi:hypothetical protein